MPMFQPLVGELEERSEAGVDRAKGSESAFNTRLDLPDRSFQVALPADGAESERLMLGNALQQRFEWALVLIPVLFHLRELHVSAESSHQEKQEHSDRK